MEEAKNGNKSRRKNGEGSIQFKNERYYGKITITNRHGEKLTRTCNSTSREAVETQLNFYRENADYEPRQATVRLYCEDWLIH